MEQVIFGNAFGGPSVTATTYNSPIGAGYSWFGTEGARWKIISTGGKIKNLRVKLDGVPGAGKSYTFTLMVNSAPSTLTLTISDAETSGADISHEVDVAAGNTVSLRCVPAGTPDSVVPSHTLIFEGSTANESLILGGTGNAPLDKIATDYGQIMGGRTTSSNTENDHRQVCPTSGKIKNLYVVLSESPGTPPDDAYRFTLRKNGESQTLTVTITADDITGNDTEHEVTVAAEDVLTLMIEPVDTPAASPAVNWGMTFLADIDGESLVLAGTDDNLNNGVTEYIFLQADDHNTWASTEATCYSLGQTCTLKKLYVLLSTFPGGGKSYTLTLRKPGNGQADGNLTVTIAEAATTGNDTVNEDAIANDDYVDLKCTPAGTPIVADAYWGVVGYIAPPEVEKKHTFRLHPRPGHRMEFHPNLKLG